jgi:hypothetical protein
MFFAAQKRFSSSWEMTILIWLNSLSMLLYGLHLISSRWVVGIFFSLLISLATVKAFLDFRRKSS